MLYYPRTQLAAALADAGEAERGVGGCGAVETEELAHDGYVLCACIVGLDMACCLRM